MKQTARERAEELARQAGLQGTPMWYAVVDGGELRLKEYARDQRNACAEAVSALDANYEHLPGTARVQMEGAAGAMQDDAHAAVMNTPFPGEGSA